MAIDVKRVPFPEHPQRCKSSAADGQCMNLSVDGKEYCQYHKGSQKSQPAGLMYKVAVLQARMEEMFEAEGRDPVASLRGEIALLRAKLEGILSLVKGNADLVIHSQQINMTVQLIGKLVVDSRKLETSLGHLLDRSSAMALADKIVSAVSETMSQLPLPEDFDLSTLISTLGAKIGGAIDTAIMKKPSDCEVAK